MTRLIYGPVDLPCPICCAKEGQYCISGGRFINWHLERAAAFHQYLLDRKKPSMTGYVIEEEDLPW